MNTQKFIDNFTQITLGSKNLNELRKLILVLGIQGKLVEQDLSDRSVSELLREHLKKDEKGKLPIVDIASLNLPSNWKAEYLGRIASQITKGATPTTYDYQFQSNGVRFIKVENIDNGSIIHESIRDYISEEANIAQARSQLEVGDILFSIAGTIGKTCVVKPEDLPANVNQALAIIRGTQQVFYSKFLKFQLDSFVANAVKDRARGGAMNNVSLGDLRELLVFIPPIAEQEYIAEQIEHLFFLCDQLEKQQRDASILRQKANTAIAKELLNFSTTKDLTETWTKYQNNFTTLLDATDNIEVVAETLKTLAVLGKLGSFSGTNNPQEIVEESLMQKNELLMVRDIAKQKMLPSLSKNEVSQIYPSHWTVTKFDDLANVSGGVTKGRSFKGRKTSSYPYLRVANVQRGYFLLDDVQEIEIPDDEFHKYSLKDGDILMTEGGDWDKVGRTAIWRNQVPVCLHQNHVFKARLFSEKIFKEWVELVFNSSIGRQYWENAAKQTTNLASINMTQVRSFPFPVPSQEEQEYILVQLEKLLSICDALRGHISRFKDTQEKFSKAAIYSILNGQPRSKIMPTDNNIEPKSFKKQISVEIALVPKVSNNLANTKLANILQENGGKMEAKELWKISNIKEIDDFYALLKQEIEAGFIQQPKIAEVKLAEEIE